MLTLSQAPPAHINDYPPERNYARQALGVSLGAHIFVVVLIGVIAFIFHVKSLRDLMMQGGSLEMHATPPDQKIEVFLKDDLPPPPPLPTPEFVRQIVKPPPAPVVVPKPKPKLKPAPAPVMAVRQDEGESRLIAGTTGLPRPVYPPRAKLMHISGTVVIAVSFDGSGKAVSANVVSSSGASMLDESASHFILEHWSNANFAGKSGTVPIEYTLTPQ